MLATNSLYRIYLYIEISLLTHLDARMQIHQLDSLSIQINCSKLAYVKILNLESDSLEVETKNAASFLANLEMSQME